MFGKYETGQRLFLSGVGALYALKGDEQRVLKVVQPPQGIWTDEQLASEIDGFLLRLKTQREIAKNSKRWAAVYDVKALRASNEGSAEESGGAGGGEDISRSGSTVGPVPESIVRIGAYAILDRYERSVQSLIEGRVRLTNDDLRNLFSSVIHGLLELRKVENRPHGNMKPSNILLTNSADLAHATVHLSDPAAAGSLTAKSAEKDLGEIGKILFELVNLRPYAGGTIGPSKDWNRLGPNGEDWRKLCNALLDPGAPAAERDLEKIVAQIETWLAQPKKSKAPLLIAAAGGVLVVGGVATWLLLRPAKIDFNEARWQKLCLGYHAWFETFDENFDDAKQKLSAEPYPVGVVKLMNDASRDRAKISPQAISKQGGRSKDLAGLSEKDENFVNISTGYGPNYTKEGTDLIDGIAQAMSPAQWPLLGKLDATAKAYEQRGWLKAAAAIRGLVASAQPPVIPTQPADVAERIKEIKPVDVLAKIGQAVQGAETVATIDHQWDTIEAEIKKLPATHVPLLDAFPKFAEEYPRTLGGGATSQPGKPVEGTLEDVKNLATAFVTIEQVVTKLAADLNRADAPIDFAEFAKDPAVQLPGSGGGAGGLTLAMYEHVPEMAQGYVKLPVDPRGEVAWEAALEHVETSSLRVITQANPRDVHLGTLAQDRDAVKAEVATVESISPIVKNREQLVMLVTKAKSDLEHLTAEGNEWVSPYIIHPADFIAQQRARLATPPARIAQTASVVRDEWAKADAAFLEKVARESSGLTVYPYDTFVSYDGKFKALENIYAAFDAKIPAEVAGLSSIQGSDWRHTIAAKVAVQDRAAALTELMTTPALKWENDLPQVDNPAYQSFARERLAAYERLRQDAVSLLGDYGTILSRLDQLELQKDEPSVGAPSWRALSEKWKQSGSPLLADGEVVAALRPITTRVGDLQAAESLTDYRALVQTGGSPAGEVALTCWRKLGGAAVNETLPVLQDEDTLEAHIVGLLNASTRAGTLPAARAAAIGEEMKAQRPIRWRRWTDTLVSAAPLQTALDHRAAYGVVLDPQSDARLVFDEAFYNLRKQSDANLKEAELKRVAQAFISSVNTMPTTVTGDAGIQALLARIAKPLQQSNEESSSAGAGPKLAGWEQDPSANSNVRLFYFPSKAAAKHTLEFDRLQVGQKTVYLCTTDVWLGLFAEVANTPAVFADINNAGKAADKAHWFTASNDPWSGPRVWRIDGGKFVANTTWLPTDPQITSFYPANAVPEPPSGRMPMQQLSPWSALYIAHALGCRLPTSEEWKAAYDKFEVTATSKDAWNLRGAAWQTQQDYAKQVVGSGVAGMPFPDKGMFNTADLMYAGITDAAAIPWHNDAIAKIAPGRVSGGADIYKGSTIWFRKVGTQPGQATPGTGSGDMHDLVGNVAEYVLDGPNANAVIKVAKPTVDSVDAEIAGANVDLGVIGGSALSPPQIPFNQKQALVMDSDQTAGGFSDVGFRLAYTAPIDSINDVLAAVFKEPKYLAVKP
jgi:hypothetical protein